MTNKKHPKRLARSAAVQGLYQWQLNPVSVVELKKDMAECIEPKTDKDYMTILLSGAIEEHEEIDALLTEYGSRPPSKLNAIELAILRVATYELKEQPGVPYRVVVNEAVELAKEYGSPDGYKYVNAVLNAMLDQLRKHERAG
jgi:transcription antitermination protein NusB